MFSCCKRGKLSRALRRVISLISEEKAAPASEIYRAQPDSTPRSRHVVSGWLQPVPSARREGPGISTLPALGNVSASAFS